MTRTAFLKLNGEYLVSTLDTPDEKITMWIGAHEWISLTVEGGDKEAVAAAKAKGAAGWPWLYIPGVVDPPARCPEAD